MMWRIATACWTIALRRARLRPREARDAHSTTAGIPLDRADRRAGARLRGGVAPTQPVQPPCPPDRGVVVPIAAALRRGSRDDAPQDPALRGGAPARPALPRDHHHVLAAAAAPCARHKVSGRAPAGHGLPRYRRI